MSGTLRAERPGCRSCRLHPESPKAQAVFLVQRYAFLPAQGTVFVPIPIPPRSWWHLISLLRAAAGFRFLLSPSSLVGSVSRLLAGSPGLSAVWEPPSPLFSLLSVPWQTAWGEKRAGVRWLPLLKERGQRWTLCCGQDMAVSPHTSIELKQWGVPRTPELPWVHRGERCWQCGPR